ncbi:hypothetical protein AK812_SmicGene31671 [Symbiodinium microadriaticum]|uniref:Uncharacterized protein n=1 Tax=Symbiodinium microadriaticum TaxID=2951 RepID=A0A1Q9CW52_SYMMI|nr:hypothetical protein AK812_SmicGene31671 [Symbiodinium microadriaticum]
MRVFTRFETLTEFRNVYRRLGWNWADRRRLAWECKAKVELQCAIAAKLWRPLEVSRKAMRVRMLLRASCSLLERVPAADSFPASQFKGPED